MEATRRLLGTFFAIGILAFLAGCSHSSGVNPVVKAECASQAKPMTFLVKWIKSVPAEYASLKIHPQMLTTRFDNISASDLEKNVLSRYPKNYEIAEHEFSIQSINQESVPVPPSVWAPQDIQISEAWNSLGKKGEGIIVAVVDSGADVNHPLLQSRFWTNPGETGLDKNGRDKSTNGIDDDGNGLIDDYKGWDFDGNVGDVTDGANHGTHVSGIIAGQADQASGFTGVVPNAKIMPLKFISGDGSGSVTNAILAMKYATDYGAKVINASWGGSACSSILQQQIISAAQSGTVFVNASGNGDANGIGYDISQIPEWPAVYQITGKITVGSYNLQQVLSKFSNYGALVDLAAPGETIISTVPPDVGQGEGQMASKSGTSMATPYVAGVVALLMSAKPGATINQIVDAINNSVIPGRYGVRTGGKLNALNAAKYLLSH